MREVKPQMMSMVPRLLEKVYEAMLNRLRQAGFIKKNLGKLAFSLAYKQRSILRPFLSPIFDLLVYNKLREALGGQMRALILGGAPLSPSLGRFFTNVGVNHMIHMVSVSGTKKLHQTDRVRICYKTRYFIERRSKFSFDAQ